MRFSLFAFHHVHLSMRARFEERDEKIAAPADKVTKFEEKIGIIETRYDDQEAEQSKNDIVISGEAVPEHTSFGNF